MELVNNICLENGIDLDDESDISPSQTIKGDALDDEDEFVNLDELIGKHSDAGKCFQYNVVY